MSPKRRSRGWAPPSARPARHRVDRLVVLVMVALAIGAAALLPRLRRPGPGRRAGATLASDHDLLDSLQAADARRDWVSALHWAEELGTRRPRDHTVMLARGTAWSNYAVDARPGRVRPRPAMRTSLERAACMRLALALMDSSGLIAPSSKEWLKSGLYIGNLYETMGLSGDALLAYETMKQRLPGEVLPAIRAYWLRALFYDPIHPDTSAYHERMKSLGLR